VSGRSGRRRAPDGKLCQTIETATIARELPHRPWHDATAADVTRLLWTLRDDRRITHFVRCRLGPILHHDSRRAGTLMHTLWRCPTHYWKGPTAPRALHLNRQAPYPRLTRVERLLSVILNDMSVRFELDLAEGSPGDGEAIRFRVIAPAARQQSRAARGPPDRLMALTQVAPLKRVACNDVTQSHRRLTNFRSVALAKE
jgi:hypothetical protein